MEEEGNPADFILEDGRALFHKVDGSAGKSCASCHGENGAKLKGIAVSYPKYNASVNGVLTLPMQINMCREKNSGIPKEKSWKYGKAEITAVELFVKSLSNGMPIKVKTDGPAKAFYEAGKKNFYGKLGEWNWNCAQCHVKYAGRYSRQELLPPTPLLADHWPSFRLDWGKDASGPHTRNIQDRFKGCIKNMRVSDDKIPDFETEYMRNLELYVTAQANGRLQQAPGFRR
jgi:sulfur-oxidizing protein SoxA